MQRESLSHLLKHAKQKNTKLGVTGFLVYTEPPSDIFKPQFAQWIEGPKEIV